MVVYDDSDDSGCGNEAAGKGYSLESVDPAGSGDCTNFRSMELASGNFPVGGTPGSDNHLWVGTSCPCLALDHFQCYKVRELSSVGDASVSLRDQLGEQELVVKDAETLCVPSFKEVLGNATGRR